MRLGAMMSGALPVFFQELWVVDGIRQRSYGFILCRKPEINLNLFIGHKNNHSAREGR